MNQGAPVGCDAAVLPSDDADECWLSRANLLRVPVATCHAQSLGSDTSFPYTLNLIHKLPVATQPSLIPLPGNAGRDGRSPRDSHFENPWRKTARRLLFYGQGRDIALTSSLRFGARAANIPLTGG